MKKHDDGYVLPFVLMVMIVLCIMSTSLMTAALRNLKNQQKFTEQMVEKYAAEGEIEKIVAQLSREVHFKDLKYELPEGTETEWPEDDEIKDEIKNEIKSDILVIIENLIIENLIGEDLVEYSGDKITITDNEEEKYVSCILKVKSSKESPIITAEIELSGAIVIQPPEDEVTSGDPGTTEKTYSISDLKLIYKSYEISRGGGT